MAASLRAFFSSSVSLLSWCPRVSLSGEEVFVGLFGLRRLETIELWSPISPSCSFNLGELGLSVLIWLVNLGHIGLKILSKSCHFVHQRRCFSPPLFAGGGLFLWVLRKKNRGILAKLSEALVCELPTLCTSVANFRYLICVDQSFAPSDNEIELRYTRHNKPRSDS